MKKILIIIPAYNEEENILKTYSSILEYNKHHKTSYDVLVVNDCSIDKTKAICEENKIPTVHLIHNLGIGGAVQTGYKYAKEHNYDIAVQFDGDGQHNIECVPIIVEPIINDNADFVIGSRFIDENSSEFKSSFFRRIGIKIISASILFVTGKKVKDTTSGFRAINNKVIVDFSEKYPSEYPEPITNAELLKKGYVLQECPVHMNERIGGESSIKAWKTIYYMVNVILTILVIKIRRYNRVK